MHYGDGKSVLEFSLYNCTNCTTISRLIFIDRRDNGPGKKKKLQAIFNMFSTFSPCLPPINDPKHIRLEPYGRTNRRPGETYPIQAASP